MSSKKSSDSSKREVNVSGMSFLRGSANYVWCTTSVLGKGATGAVFQGVNRHTGEPVAVKTFNQLSHMRPHEVQMREFEVLKKVNHESIVKLLAIEEEQEGRGKVIVMELCTGGSLFNILDDPENSHGLEEGEFLLVLRHLAAGMKHLRDNSLVHRDLKPGNIMKFIHVDGSTIYKLTDFGAARELHDDQQFMSLYGTEEYLHPDMYERAVLRKPVGKTFGARVDLWSIGVTLYHVATGLLPFRPFGGRRNKETMYLITTEKAPGVISGVQTTENGAIDWSTTLPETCQLSMGLRKLVTPLLAGLLEVDPLRMWNFERFFDEVTQILARKVLHIFQVNKVLPLTLYIDPRHKFEEVQYMIFEQTELSPESQLLLFDNKHLSDIVDSEQPALSYPDTTQRSPVAVFSREDDDVTLTLPETPALKFGSFPALVSVEHDAAVGKSMCGIGHAIKRIIDHQSKCVYLTEYSVLMFVEVMVQELNALKSRLNHMQALTSAVTDRFSQLVANHRRFLVLTQVCGAAVEDGRRSGVDEAAALRDRLEDLVDNKVDAEKATCGQLDTIVAEASKNEQVVRDSLNAIVPVVRQLHERVVGGNQLKRQWSSGRSVGNSVEISLPQKVDRAPNKAATYVTKLRESWQHLLRDRAARTLTFNDEQFHLLEKMKMKETGKSLDSLLTSVSSALTQTTDALADWCKVAQVQRVQAEIEEADVSKHEHLLCSFRVGLSDTEDRYHNTLSQILANIKDTTLQDHARLLIQAEEEIEDSDDREKTMTTTTTTTTLATNETTGDATNTQKTHKDNANKAKIKMSLREMYQTQEQVMKLLEENGTIIKRFQRLASPPSPQ